MDAEAVELLREIAGWLNTLNDNVVSLRNEALKEIQAVRSELQKLKRDLNQ